MSDQEPATGNLELTFDEVRLLVSATFALRETLRRIRDEAGTALLGTMTLHAAQTEQAVEALSQRLWTLQKELSPGE